MFESIPLFRLLICKLVDVIEKHITKEKVNFGIKEDSVGIYKTQEIDNNNQISLF